MRSVSWTALTILAGASLLAAQPPSTSCAWEIGIVDRPLTIEKVSFDPSGQTLVYGADQEVDDRFELYIARQGRAVFLTQLGK